MLSRIQGFTLVELMVVTVIVGLIASIGIPRFREQLLISRLKEAEPYLQAIAAKQRINFVQTGNYIRTDEEDVIQAQLGIDLTGVGNFCFMTFCAGANCDVPTGATATVGNPIDPFVNAGQAVPADYFEVYALLRDYTTDSNGGDNVLGNTGTIAQNCVSATNKTTAAGWVATADVGRVVVLRYPAPIDSTSAIGSDAFEWRQGVSNSGVLLGL